MHLIRGQHTDHLIQGATCLDEAQSASLPAQLKILENFLVHLTHGLFRYLFWFKIPSGWNQDPSAYRVLEESLVTKAVLLFNIL